jgi:hypothetical protein
MQIHYSRTLEATLRPDVLVCGGGVAGLGAAVAAARAGASTLLVERMGFAGGFFTAVIGSSFDGLIDPASGRPVVGGLVFEMLDRLGVLQGRDPLKTQFTYNGEISSLAEHPDWIVPRTEPERFKKAADDVLTDAGVHVLFHTQVADVVMRGQRIEAVIVSNKDGLVAIAPKIVVDCTGDADVAAWAGAPFELHEELQPMGLHFRLIDVHAPADMALRQKAMDLFQRAQREGRLSNFGGPYPARFMAHDLYFNATRIPGNPTDPEDWTRAEIQGRRDAWAMYEILKSELPEFASSYFIASGPTAGARESRRIVGKYVLTADDIRAGRRQSDAVVVAAGKIDRHSNSPTTPHQEFVVPPYDIGYRTLLPQRVENLLVAGRCHSATSEALASSRLTAPAMGMGQAAGTAAALSALSSASPQSLDTSTLQNHLRRQGALLPS